jgi:hypothetical protein
MAIVCTECGMSLPSGTTRCTNCGANLVTQPPVVLTRDDIFWGVLKAMFAWSLIVGAVVGVIWLILLASSQGS